MIQNPSPLAPQILAELEIQNLVNYHAAVPGGTFRSFLKTLYSVEEIAGIRDLASFSCQSAELKNIDGIEYATNLASINIEGSGAAGAIDLSNSIALQNVLIDFTSVTDIGSPVNWLALTYINLTASQFAQSALETVIDGLWANRIVLGTASCQILLASNPGSTAAASSRATEIADLIAAGCSVTI